MPNLFFAITPSQEESPSSQVFPPGLYRYEYFSPTRDPYVDNRNGNAPPGSLFFLTLPELSPPQFSTYPVSPGRTAIDCRPPQTAIAPYSATFSLLVGPA